MYYSVDRIEGNTAVLVGYDESSINAALNRLPENVREGDILRFENGSYIYDEQETNRRKEEIDARFKRLFKKH